MKHIHLKKHMSIKGDFKTAGGECGMKHIHLKKHMSILGFKVKDRVTGFCGVAVSVSFDLYGCIQVVVNPGLGKDGKLGDQCWFDINRLERTSTKRVMDVPNFDFGPVAEGGKGPSEKPGFCKA